MISTLLMVYYIVVVLVSSLYVSLYIATMLVAWFADRFLPQYHEETASLLLWMSRHHWPALIICVLAGMLDIWRYF